MELHILIPFVSATLFACLYGSLLWFFRKRMTGVQRIITCIALAASVAIAAQCLALNR